MENKYCLCDNQTEDEMWELPGTLEIIWSSPLAEGWDIQGILPKVTRLLKVTGRTRTAGIPPQSTHAALSTTPFWRFQVGEEMGYFFKNLPFKISH